LDAVSCDTMNAREFVAMPVGSEPDADQVAQLHGRWRGSLDRTVCPSLRFVERLMYFETSELSAASLSPQLCSAAVCA